MPFTQFIISIICPKHGPWHMLAVDPPLPLLLPLPLPPLPVPLPPLLLPLPLPPLPVPLPLALLFPPPPLLLPLTLMPIAWRHPFITYQATLFFLQQCPIAFFFFCSCLFIRSIVQAGKEKKRKERLSGTRESMYFSAF
jgi:hypothetical protein